MNNLRKFANGGPSVFVTYTPFTSPTSEGPSGSSTSGGSQNSESKLSDKDLMTMIKDIDGLPSDMQIVFNQISMMTNMSGIPGSTSGLQNTYLKALQLVKTASWNKTQYDEAKKLATEKGGLSEVAITTDGQVVVRNKEGEISQMGVQEYLKARAAGQVQALTNSNLLYMRAHDKTFANNNGLFEVVQNGIGYEAINKMINDTISSLGNFESGREGYQSATARKGIRLLQELHSKGIDVTDLQSIDGLYKSKVVSQDQRNQIQLAINYIWNNLPTNARTLLALKSGNVNNPDQGALDQITMLISSRGTSKITFDTTLQEDINLDGSKKSSEKDGLKENTAAQFLYGRGAEENIVINPGGILALNLTATKMPIGLGQASLSKIMSDSEFKGMLDTRFATIDGVKINDAGWQHIINRDGQIYSIDLPINIKEKNATGIIKPDFQALQRMKEADEEIKANNIVNPDEANKIYAKHQLPFKYNSQGQLITSNYARFGAMHVYADNKAFNGDVTFSNLREVTDDNELETSISLMKQANNWTDKEYRFDENNWYDWNGHDSMYSGILYVPIVENVFNALAGSNTSMTGSQSSNLQDLQAQTDLMKRYQNPGSLQR